MASFWDKFKNIFQSFREEESDEEIDVSYPKEIPLDERFVDYFVRGGGHFFYCEDKEEARAHFIEILENTDIDKVVCFDKNLQLLLKSLGVNFIDYPSSLADANFIGCEGLIAYNGAIMLSGNQTGGRKITDLCDYFIIYATTDQIHKNLTDAMQYIKRKNEGNYPTGITTIGGINTSELDETPENQEIFLLLVENG